MNQFLFVPYANAGKEMLNEHESVIMYVRGRCLAAQAERHANAAPDAQLSTSKNKKKASLSYQAGQEVSRAHP